MTINLALAWAMSKLKRVTKSSSLDTEVLLAFVLKKHKTYLYLNPNRNLTPKQFNEFENLVKKRALHWPVAHLTGHKEFFGLDFKVSPNVLIPRPETELLVELALDRIKHQKKSIKQVIDIGTGAGNIIVSLTAIEKNAATKQSLKFYASDTSKKALQIAKLNARYHRVSKNIKFLHGNLLDPFSKLKKYALPTLIVTNLPYGWKEWKNNTSSDTQGLKYEPSQALFTKEGGLYHIHQLFKQISLMLHVSSSMIHVARLLLEFDPRQKTALTKLANKYFPQARQTFHKDLSGKNRVLEICF